MAPCAKKYISIAYEICVTIELAHKISLGIDFLRVFGASSNTENDELILKLNFALTTQNVRIITNKRLECVWMTRS